MDLADRGTGTGDLGVLTGGVTREPTMRMEQLLLEEPFVRSLAHALLAGEADEVVQQTWLLALQSRARDVRRPRSWLARIARNVAANLRRGDRRRGERERAVALTELLPSSAELMEREERRHALVQAVDRLPATLRSVVLLRFFEGLPPRRIAVELGLPVATVWNQLRRALALLRERLDAEHGGDRRAWLLPLLPFAAAPRGVPMIELARPELAGPSLLTGAIAMTTKTKVLAAALLLLALSAAFVWWPDGGAAPSPRDAAPAPAVAAAERTAAPPSAPDEPAATERVAAVAAPAPTTGALVVHVRYGDDHAPAADLTIIVGRKDSERRLDVQRARTDATGAVRFEALPPGQVAIETSHNSGPGKSAEIRAGETVEVELQLRVGLTVTGVVVDRTGTPVSGAVVEMAPLAFVGHDAEPVAITDALGRFLVRSCIVYCLVGARAEGHAASPLRFLIGKDGDKADVRIELSEPGGDVDGIVVRPDGLPAQGAVVRVGRGRMESVSSGGDGAPPLPAQVRTDAEGRFHAFGVPAGEQPMMVRAVGLAPWTGSCEVSANLAATVRVALTAGATCVGVVRTSTGDPAKGAEVRVGRPDNHVSERDDFLHHRARAAADGSFRLDGLPAGDVEIDVAHADFGKATAVVHTVAGATTSCEITLSRGLELRGRVVDDTGAPVPEARIELAAALREGRSWSGAAMADRQGAFAVGNCPEDTKLSVQVRGRNVELTRIRGVDPHAGEVVLRVPRAQKASVHIVGAVVGPDGRPVANAKVSASRQQPREGSGIRPTAADGRFELGPLVPGSWQVGVQGSGLPEFQTGWHEVAAGGIWDLGTIRLVQGGTAVVRPVGDTAGVTFVVVDAAASNFHGVALENGSLRTVMLAPGRYFLLAYCKGKAAQSVPFEIKAGDETQVEVRITAGIRQRVELVLAGEPPAGASIRVHRGDVLVASEWIGAREGEPFAGELWLAPGDYSLTATADKLAGRAPLTVGDREGPPLRIELR